MKAKFTKEQKDEIVRLYTVEEKTGKEIAKIFNVNFTTIYKILNKQGIEIQTKGRNFVLKKLGIQEFDIIKKFQETESLRSTGDFFKISVWSVKRIIKKHGCKSRTKRVRDSLENNKDLIIRLYEEGKTGWEISEIVNVNGQSLYTYLHELGLNVASKRSKQIQNILSQNKQIIYDLYFLEKFTFSEIANIYNMSVSAIEDFFKANKWKPRKNPYSFESSTERCVKKILEELNIYFQSQFKIENRIYDFYLKDLNLIIEVNGDYWHANPKMFKKLNKIQKASKIRDRIKKKLAREHNYQIIFLWEDDIKNNLEKVIKKIKQYANKYQKIKRNSCNTNTSQYE